MPLSPDSAIQKDLRTQTPAMQHRHFAFIAAIIRQEVQEVAMFAPADRHGAKRQLEHIAFNFANQLRKSNPAFDRNRFLAACGIEEGVF